MLVVNLLTDGCSLNWRTATVQRFFTAMLLNTGVAYTYIRDTPTCSHMHAFYK